VEQIHSILKPNTTSINDKNSTAKKGQIHSTKTVHDTSNSTQKPKTTSINDKKYYSQINK